MTTLGRVYKLSCNRTGKTYIGSTIQPLKKRLQGHESAFRLGLRHASAEIIENGDYKMEELICKECSRQDLLVEEQNQMNLFDCVNYKKAYRKPEDKDYYKNMSHEKKQEFLARKRMLDKESYEDCICGSRFNRAHRSRHFRTQKHRDALAILQNNLNRYI